MIIDRFYKLHFIIIIIIDKMVHSFPGNCRDAEEIIVPKHTQNIAEK